MEKDEWVNVRFPLNKGNTRDIPPYAILHESLRRRLQDDADYIPTNNHGGDTGPCLRHRRLKGPDGKDVKTADGKARYELPDLTVVENGDEDHRTWRFTNPTLVG